jgi:hypothetical protein
MPQGIICISPITAFKDTFDLTIDPALIDLGKLKEALLLPDRYTVERVNKPIYGPYRDCAEIIVSSPDIPESQGESLPTVTPCYLSTTSSEAPKTYIISLQGILINGVSAIREEDKEHKRIRGFKEVKDLSARSARDTQFRGFAKALVTEITDEVRVIISPLNTDISDKLEKLIARRAYELAKHVIDNLRANYMEDWKTKQIMPKIPDLTKWPRNP